MVMNCDFHFYVVSLVIMTNVDKIRRIEDNIMLIMHNGGGLERGEYQSLQYVRGEFCV